MKKDYYLGLDMGTSSVGWAVTDEQYNLIRAKGKDLWGIREFEEANTSAERRTFRVSRRRRQRELVRIGYLKDYFADEIDKIDPNFYQRMANSKYFLEDKDSNVKTPNALFDDPEYKDRDYFEQYPTIFHLRSELFHSSAPHDVRLVFLAVLNIFKHRGHFLNAGLSSENDSVQMGQLYDEFRSEVSEKMGIVLPQNIDVEKLQDILGSRDYNRTKKSEKIIEILDNTASIDGLEKAVQKRRKEVIKELSRLICGLNLKDAGKIFDLDSTEPVSISFSSGDFDEKADDIASAIGDENYAVVDVMKRLHDAGVLAGVLKGYDCLSDSRVADYKKHHEDLKTLKAAIKKHGTDADYNLLFRSEESGSYSAYVNHVNYKGKRRRNMKGRKADELYTTIKKMLKDYGEDESVKYILDEIDKQTFLPKQLTSANGVIPNQVHLRELKKILSNAEEYLPFLKEKNEAGLTVSEQIIEIFKFQIPYYIGPLSENSHKDKSGGNGWVVRKETGTVMPWNIQDKVDIPATAEEFISRMVRKCTYISGEQAMPKASLLYQRYCVLNEINNICIDGQRLPVEDKQGIYTDLFEKGKSVTKKQLADYLRSRGLITDDSQISGIDIKINNSLSSYGKFYAIFGDKMREDHYRDMAEKIIFWITVYGGEKKILKEKIQSAYGDELDDQQIKRILALKFKDWGRLSRSFIELEGVEKSTGEVYSLIRAMWETQSNMMELINSSEYTFKDELKNLGPSIEKSIQEFRFEDLEEMYFSAPVKRMVWQTILIIRELEKVLGKPPKKLFVEMTRGEQEKKRTTTRKQKFLDLYKNVKEEDVKWKEVIEDADKSGVIRSKKMYLYLTQKGRCMYTGKHIDLNDLFNNNLYDIDHIYPQSLTKDDSLDNNMVLVRKENNGRKSDRYPLDQEIVSNQIALWGELHRKGFINDEKYKRLTDRTPLTDEKLAGFIARQIVETSQGTKGVADLIRDLMPETAVVYSKASNVSDFRQKYELYKSRIVNDFHHAKDAYLNIVVGNVYDVKFTRNPLRFIKEEYRTDQEKNKYHLSKMFRYDIRRGDTTAWIAGDKETGEGGTIVTVKKVMDRNTPLLTRMSFSAINGGLADQTLYSAKKAKPNDYLPLKTNDEKLADVTKYGGVTNMHTAYFFLVEFTEKKKRVRTLEALPIYVAKRIESSPEVLEQYCENVLGLKDYSVRIRKINIQSLVKRNGFALHITGKTGNRLSVRNATSLCLSQKWVNYLKKLENTQIKGWIDEGITAEHNVELYDELLKKHRDGIFSNRPNCLGEKLEKRRNLFSGLSLEQQISLLIQLLNTTGIVAGGSADLTLLDESKQTGVMLIPKKISTEVPAYLIHQSITGIYEKEIDLRTV